ncbi:MAG: hypothetical protein ACK5VN_10695 [Phycisphaerae bacterium]
MLHRSGANEPRRNDHPDIFTTNRLAQTYTLWYASSGPGWFLGLVFPVATVAQAQVSRVISS